MVKKTKNIQYYEATGRRREAVARVRLYIAGKDKMITLYGNKVKQGEMLVNKQPIHVVFPMMYEKATYLKPLKLTSSEDRFVISIITHGGGRTGQLEAIVHGLSRALEKVDTETNRPILKKELLLRRDPRTRERRMVGTGGKARRAKQSPKR